MDFPILNISRKKWNFLEQSIPTLFDDRIYSTSEDFFNEEYKNQLYCDCRGNVYMATHFVLSDSFWRKTFRFLPFLYKGHLKFKKVDRRVSHQELKSYVIDRINDLEPSEFNTKWINQIEASINVEEIICAQIK